VGLLLMAGTAACRGTVLDAPAAVVTDEELEVSPATLPPSYVSAPVLFDLRPLLAELEATIPRRIGSVEKEDRIQVSGQVWVAPELQRGPLHFSFEDNSVTVATEFAYRARAWVRPLLVEMAVSCGMGDVRPRLRLRLRTTYEVTPDWRLRTRTRLVELEPVTELERDQCEVSFLRLDVTERVVGAAQDALRNALRRVDRDVARFNLRRPMADLWAKLQEPIPIKDGAFWFEIRPMTVSLGAVVSEDTALVAQLDMLAMPRMTSGPRPVPDSTPLPALERTTEVVDTAMVLIEGVLDYPSATRLLGGELAGKSFGVLLRRVRVDGVTVLPAGGGKVLLAIRLSGGARGVVYAVGTPHYDPATDLITVPDLSFDLNSLGYLRHVAAWLVNGSLMGDIRARAQIPASGLLGDALVLANQEINRELTDGVWLRGQFAEARTLTVVAARRGLVVQARSTGQLRLEISKDNLLPDRPVLRR
jgi:hypothetical protein